MIDFYKMNNRVVIHRFPALNTKKVVEKSVFSSRDLPTAKIQKHEESRNNGAIVFKKKGYQSKMHNFSSFLKKKL
ncbi:MAG: hypothetical protein SPL48_02805 [Bacteroidales bacterium]|nr:hypothetical protein [Bacteroidales bacterium]